jgi:hypothetical protein
MAVAEMKKREIKRKHLQDNVADSPELPLLENGDHVTREEFERRYDAMPYLKKAELIEGRVYMPACAQKS